MIYIRNRPIRPSQHFCSPVNREWPGTIIGP
nr:MAG TPA: hypothetical protein [Caudoviricetes sp.]